MLTLFLSGLYLFLFLFAWYILLSVGFEILKTIILRSGKANLSKWTNPVVGICVSYIIMALIIGL